MPKALVVWVLTGFLACSAISETQASPPWQVSFEVSGETRFSDDVRSYVGREFRDLGDVEVVSTKNSTLHLAIIMQELRWYEGFAMVGLWYKQDPEKGKADINSMEGFTYSGRPGELREAVRKLVVQFDQKVLNPLRTTNRAKKLRDKLREQTEKGRG